MKYNKDEKNIWIYWHDGWDKAPYTISICAKSWFKNNPEWNVKLLDSKYVKNFIDIEVKDNIFKELCIAHKSDLIRLLLLKKYGGVWVDASLFCITPLDIWLEKFLSSGIFMFESSTKSTIIANWFIAAKKNNIFIKKLIYDLNNY